jgi:hypothetical protein
VTPAAGSHSYDHGALVEVAALPQDNYEFKEWTGTAVEAGKVKPGSEPHTFVVTVDGNYTLRAHFALVKRVLDVSATTGGAVAPAAGRYDWNLRRGCGHPGG